MQKTEALHADNLSRKALFSLNLVIFPTKRFHPPMKPHLALIAAFVSLASVLLDVAATDLPTSSAHADRVNTPDSSLNRPPLAVDVLMNRKSDKIHSVVVTHIEPGSELALAGLIPGDEITTINGQAVRDFVSAEPIESELIELFLAGPPDGNVQLEVLTKRTKEVTLFSTTPTVHPSTEGRRAKRRTKKDDPAIELEPFRVSGTPITSFPLELRVVMTKETRAVTSIIITDVLSSEETTRADIRAGDEILKINGRPVGDADDAIKHQSELTALLVNRPLHEKLRIEVRSPRLQTVTLRRSALAGSSPHGDEPKTTTPNAR
jgi:membrane-associated protease RseP (regulator of RpoE activity)